MAGADPRSLITGAAAPGGRLRPGLKLDDLAELWITARAPSAHTIYTTRLAVRTFKTLIGDLYVRDISHDDMIDFRDMLALIPAVQTWVERSALLEEMFPIWMADTSGRARLAPPSVRNKLNAIQALIGLAFAECWIERDQVRGVPAQKAAIRPIRSFTREEGRALFALPHFVKLCCEQIERSKTSHATLRWISFLGLMAGDRCEEIAQLHVSDVVQPDGVWAIRINVLGPEGQLTNKHLKNLASRRLVPLHPRLVDLGLLRHAKAQRDQQHIWLFPDLLADPWGRRAQGFRGRFRMLLRKVSRDPALVFHSFRHGFKDMCRQAGIQDSVDDQLTGHAPPTIGRAHGAGIDIHSLASVVRLLDFDLIDWEPVLRSISALGDGEACATPHAFLHRTAQRAMGRVGR